MTLTFI